MDIKEVFYEQTVALANLQGITAKVERGINLLGDLSKFTSISAPYMKQKRRIGFIIPFRKSLWYRNVFIIPSRPSLGLFDLRVRCRSGFGVQPNDYKREESRDNSPETSNPDPAAGDLPAPRVLVVCKVANGDLVLLLDIGEEWTPIIDAERENAMLIRDRKSDTVDSAILRAVFRQEIETVEWRKHGELQLQSILRGNFERHKPIEVVLGEFDVERLIDVVLVPQWRKKLRNRSQHLQYHS